MPNTLKVGISVGDLNGIGMEVIIKALSDIRLCQLCTPVVYGNAKAAAFYRKAVKMPEFNFNIINSAKEAKKNKPNLVNISNEEISLNPGKASKETGAFAFKSLKAVTEDLANGELDVMVTAPIDKDSIQSSEFNFKGHTEYLTEYSNAEESLMLMISEHVKVATVTNHVAIKEVAETITKELIIQKAEILFKSLEKDFGIQKPKVALLGLNPHAGDNGTIGKEESEILLPAIEVLKERGYLIYGPYAADGYFGSGNYKNFDATLSCFHDQGLVPYKLLSFGAGVNFTAGLPIVRTSPDHGVGYDICGSNVSDPSSFRAAIYAGIDIFKTRNTLKEWSANPLISKEEVSRNKK